MRAKFLTVILLLSCFYDLYATPVDSIGVEKKGGKLIVLHKVEEGQSLFSILKRYNSTYAEFYKANPSIKQNQDLKWQEVVKVPFHYPSKNSKTVGSIPPTTKPIETPKGGNVDEDGIEVVDIPEATPADTQTVAKVLDKSEVIPSNKTLPKPSPKTHVVVAGENLFLIAKKYTLKAWQLRLWNNLTNDNLKIGQKLILEKPASLATVPAKTPNKPATKPIVVAKKDTSKSVMQGPAGEASKPKVAVKGTPTKPAQPVPNAPGGRKISEQGVAEVFEGREPTSKFLAFHKTAPIGTLIIVRNEANGQSVWVKVIGKLASSTDAVIKISPKAYEKLQAKDRRIRASISYTLAGG